MAKETNGKQAVTETINGNLVVVREPIIGKDGKQMLTKNDNRPYFAYLVRGIIRGQEKKIDFAPKDMGGYEPLDVVFDVSPKAELIMTDEVMTDDKGVQTHYTSYKVQTVDADGDVWSCDVKPQRNSDKALLSFLLIELRKAMRKASAVE